MNITIGGTTKTYTYSTSDQLEAAYKINIDGTYTEAVGVNLTGTITGATWLGERTISFEFDEDGTNGTNGNDPSELNNSSSDIPAVGDTYQGCYVLAVNNADDYAEVTLLSPTELTGIDYTTDMQTHIDAALATVTDGDISGWEVPTTDEARLMYNAREAIGCVNSKQTEIRPVPADFVSGTAFEVYTLPHTEEDVLTKLTVTALDANDNILKERTFENIPITRNQVTRYTGSFFGSGGGNSTNDGTFRLTADPDWDAVNGYTF